MSHRPRFSAVLEVPALLPEQAYHYWNMRLSCETDVSDVAADLEKGNAPFKLLDVRSEADYEKAHVAGAISLPGRQINEQTTADWDREQVVIVYCWGPACNGATKAAAKLAQLGFQVKEMLGGIEYWRLEGGTLEGSLGNDAPTYWQMQHCSIASGG
ncbi:rhodanese-like domain-containing protein [Paenibacillus sp. WLX2291]|uniref:rhodanese-like domain-containing protein n=1 Tax=Paenibacillus sp. WLX2291 TaxID=3296934 RepID=UPI0039844A0A